MLKLFEAMLVFKFHAFKKVHLFMTTLHLSKRTKFMQERFKLSV